MGLGERHDPSDGNTDPRFAIRGPADPEMGKRPLNTNPGVGSYDIGKDGDQNNAPGWK